MICSKCGTQNADSAKFCSSCGTQLSTATPSIDPVTHPQAAQPVQPPNYVQPETTTQQVPPMAPPAGPQGQTPPPPYTGAPSQAPAYKPYKAEFVMGLIGSIIGIIIFLVMLITGIAAATTLNYFGYGIGGLAIFGSLFVLAAFILGFVGTSQVNRGNGKGGISLTVGGGLGFLGMFFGIWVGWSAIFFYPLLLTAGIMALVKRGKIEGRR